MCTHAHLWPQSPAFPSSCPHNLNTSTWSYQSLSAFPSFLHSIIPLLYLFNNIRTTLMSNPSIFILLYNRIWIVLYSYSTVVCVWSASTVFPRGLLRPLGRSCLASAMGAIHLALSLCSLVPQGFLSTAVILHTTVLPTWYYYLLYTDQWKGIPLAFPTMHLLSYCWSGRNFVSSLPLMQALNLQLLSNIELIWSLS